MTEPVFFSASRRYTAGEIAALTGGDLRTPDRGDVVVTHLSQPADGHDGSLIFISGPRNASELAATAASVVLCTEDVASAAPDGIAVVVSRQPQYDFATVGRLMFPDAVRPAPLTGESGISPAAHIHPDAHVEDGAIIEANAVIAAGAGVGAGTVIAPNAVVGPSCQIGRDCYIGPNVSVRYALIGNRVYIHGGAQIGQDGFGYVLGRNGPEKVPQLGRVIIQDDVEIGANSAVDRGTLSDTVIGEATKIDNLVQIAHNVRIGRACILAGHCGISGSVTIGDGVMLGGRVGISDHLTIGAGARIAAGSGLMNDVPPGERWGGAPAQPIKDAMREIATLRAMARRKMEDRRRGDG